MIVEALNEVEAVYPKESLQHWLDSKQESDGGFSTTNGQKAGLGTPLNIEFSPWLTSLIGGRGSGKSSILDYLRIILNQVGGLPEKIKKDFEEFAKIPATREKPGMLRPETGSPGNVIERFPVHIYSQKQLYEMTEDPFVLLNLIDSKIDKSAWQERRDGLTNGMA